MIHKMVEANYIIPRQMDGILDSIASNKGCTKSDLVSGYINAVELSNNKQQALIFKQIRCGRCSQSFTGGAKTTVALTLAQWQIDWLDTMKQRFRHKSRDKTLRILLDFLHMIGKIS